VAQAKKACSTKAGSRDDSDADLLAALVARTKPADAKPAAPAKPTTLQRANPHRTRRAPGPARPVRRPARNSRKRVKECSEQGFFEEQFCRWRVCDGTGAKTLHAERVADASTLIAADTCITSLVFFCAVRAHRPRCPPFAS